jgi:hypothetical protein
MEFASAQSTTAEDSTGGSGGMTQQSDSFLQLKIKQEKNTRRSSSFAFKGHTIYFIKN